MPLRISYKNKKMKFLFKCKKRDAKEQILSHLAHWSRGKIKDADGVETVIEIPRSDVIAEWQDGDTWKDEAPTEVIPVPGA